ncbi:MAG: hypothetical protein JXO51_08720, partial [Candidatus Aminicenantes bacterium]|nr:hypothetical protein [Candidatus Aminicenantes bacterium]
HPVYALPLDRDPARMLGRHQAALLLTAAQRDFLLNHLGLPLLEPAPPRGERKLAEVLRERVRMAGEWIAVRLPPRRRRLLAEERLSEDERRLCRGLEREWPHFLPAAAQPLPRVVMSPGRGLLAAHWHEGSDETLLILRRRHPLVRAAVRGVAAERGNVELALAALAPGRLLTGPRR